MSKVTCAWGRQEATAWQRQVVKAASTPGSTHPKADDLSDLYCRCTADGAGANPTWPCTRSFTTERKRNFMRRDVLAFGSVSLCVFLLLAATIWFLLTPR